MWHRPRSGTPTQQVLSTRTVSSYGQGLYLTWDLSGHVTVRFTIVHASSWNLRDTPQGAAVRELGAGRPLD